MDDLKSARKASEERILALAEKGPVFIFGLSISAEFKARLSNDIYVANLTTDDHVRTAIKSAAGKSKGVLSMTEGYYIGIDIKLAVEATVVICAPKIFDRDTVCQMAARGARNYGDQEVFIFIVGSKHEQATHEEKINDKTAADFFDGVFNIELVEEMMSVRFSVAGHKDYNSKAE